MSENMAQGVRWDLSDLYRSTGDPALEADLKDAETLALEFEKKYRPFFESNGSSPLPLAGLLRDYKEILTRLTKPGVFAHLSFAAKTDDPALGAFLQKIQHRITQISCHLLFFEVSWARFDERAVKKFLSDSAIAGDRHYLEKLRAQAPHTLAENEEKIMAMKSLTSAQAFSRLFDEVVNKIAFTVEIGGRRVEKTESEVLSLLHSSDRPQRKMASESLAEGLKSHTHLLTYIYNMILADHRLSLEIRKYPHPMEPRNLANEIDLKSVLHLIESVKGAYPIVRRFYRLKAKLLGLEKLSDYDRYAPIGEDREKIDFKTCREIVLEGYRAFSPKAAEIAGEFFDKRWIDAEIRQGKQGGGFCCQTTPELHPYILVNYTGSLRDVMTVAHELGHGLHQFLARKVGILESDAPLTMAETASVFGEMLIFEKLFDDEKDPHKRLGLICGKIDDNFATVFRQIAMTDFELAAHGAGIAGGELSSQTLEKLWVKTSAEMYGDSVELTDNARHGWKYIPHFIHTPFYCYAYAFAQLFVLCLYQKYKEDKNAFVPRYFEMLSLGGSKRPHDIAGLAGLDIGQKDFWRAGINFLETLVKQAETLAAERKR